MLVVYQKALQEKISAVRAGMGVFDHSLLFASNFVLQFYVVKELYAKQRNNHDSKYNTHFTDPPLLGR